MSYLFGLVSKAVMSLCFKCTEAGIKLNVLVNNLPFADYIDLLTNCGLELQDITSTQIDETIRRFSLVIKRKSNQ